MKIPKDSKRMASIIFDTSKFRDYCNNVFDIYLIDGSFLNELQKPTNVIT